MYEANFGLDPPPFRLMPDPHFYLEDGQYGTILAKLIGGLEAGEPCLLLTGPAGSGKTAAVQRLLMLLDRSRWTVGTMVASAGAAGAGVLHAAVHAFDLADADTRSGPAVDAWLSSQTARGGRVLLVVDEAEHLDDGALRQLAERLGPARATPRLQLCLVGEQAPAALAAAVRDGSVPPIVVHCRLRALDATESRDYVLHRLHCAGWTGRPSFVRAATDAIHRRSEGIPRRIHLIADRVLLQLSIDAIDVATAAAVEAADDQRTVELQGRAPIEALATGVIAPSRASTSNGTHPDWHVETAPRIEPPAPPRQFAPDGVWASLPAAALAGSSPRSPVSATPGGTQSAATASAAARRVPAGQPAAPRWTGADIRKTAAGAIMVALAGIGIGWWLGVGGAMLPPAAPGSTELQSARVAVGTPARRAIGEVAGPADGLAVPAGSATPVADPAPLSRTAPAPVSVTAEPAPVAGPTPSATPSSAAPPRAAAIARTGPGEPLPELPVRSGYDRAASARPWRDALPAGGIPREPSRAVGSAPADAMRVGEPLSPTSAAPASPTPAPCTSTAAVLGLCELAATRTPTPSPPARTAVPTTDAVSPQPLRAAPPATPCEPSRAVLGLCER